MLINTWKGFNKSARKCIGSVRPGEESEIDFQGEHNHPAPKSRKRLEETLETSRNRKPESSAVCNKYKEPMDSIRDKKRKIDLSETRELKLAMPSFSRQEVSQNASNENSFYSSIVPILGLSESSALFSEGSEQSELTGLNSGNEPHFDVPEFLADISPADEIGDDDWNLEDIYDESIGIGLLTAGELCSFNYLCEVDGPTSLWK
eukprot:TRINITY_DN5756_c0_g1_i1.p1 TRINITY_DN5756_c0_g1~~TRINITY_DN5756_c0_g1_i1.p1  ORF type:complete len:205 (+),score=32.78 TRINITY_DN5756_c0_g1_i1:162-776(+)